MKAREALRAKLEEDRKERRRKLGLPEELTEEEKAREAEKLKRRAAEEAAKHQVYVKPISGARVWCRSVMCALRLGWWHALLLCLRCIICWVSIGESGLLNRGQEGDRTIAVRRHCRINAYVLSHNPLPQQTRQQQRQSGL